MEEKTTLEALAENAAAAFGAENLRRDAQTVRIALDGAEITFADADDGFLICRAYVAALTRLDDPGALCREALEANFFWTGTDGAVLSADAAATALYLTDCVLPATVATPEALADFTDRFVETLVDWRLRVRGRQGGLGALPASADFSLPEEQQAPSDASADIVAEENGMEVFR